MPSLESEDDLVVDALEGIEGKPVEERKNQWHVVSHLPLQDLYERWREEDHQERIVAPVVTWEN